MEGPIPTHIGWANSNMNGDANGPTVKVCWPAQNPTNVYMGLQV